VDAGATDLGPPAALIAPVTATRPGVPVTLDGSASADPDGRPLTFSWTLPGQPAGASLTGASTSRATLTATAEGSYPVQLTVTAADGARAFTAAGTTFRLAPLQAQDMIYAGALSGMTAVAHLDTSAGEVAAVPPGGTTVELFDPTYLGRTGRITLPAWPVGGRTFATHGRFVFYGEGGTRKPVVVEADPSSGLLRGTAVLSF